MRLFAALVPSSDVLDDVERNLVPHLAAWPDLRWAHREQLHVTLAFYGEMDERALDRLLPRLERAAGRYSPPRLTLAGAGVFPSGGAHARVLWTGVYGDRRTLVRLAASAAAAGRRAGSGQGYEPKVFRPHLTLARCRRPMDVRPLVERLAAFASTPWIADSVHLIRSHLGPQVHYETLKTLPLG
jgi:2'-5' RNA ligase